MKYWRLPADGWWKGVDERLGRWMSMQILNIAGKILSCGGLEWDADYDDEKNPFFLIFTILRICMKNKKTAFFPQWWKKEEA